MMQAITHAAIEILKAATMAVKAPKNPVNTTRSVQAMPRTVAQHRKSKHWTGKQETNTKNYEAKK